MRRAAPSFRGLHSSSERASTTLRAVKRTDTRPERLLRSALWRRGLRYRVHCADLPGRPDIVFRAPRVVVFCDGDFWHGRDWPERRARLARGSNPTYWIRKIERNIERDREQTHALRREGWIVIRVWEGDVARDPERVARSVARRVPSDRMGCVMWQARRRG